MNSSAWENRERRRRRERWESPSVCGSGGGGSQTVTAPLPFWREGNLDQISLNTDCLSFPALRSTAAMLQHITCHSVCQPRDGQRRRIWPQKMHMAELSSCLLLLQSSSVNMAASARRYYTNAQGIYVLLFIIVHLWYSGMSDPGGLAISQADSGHLAEGFRDRHCLLSTITLIFMPCLWCPCRSLGSLFTPEIDERWQTGMSGVDESEDGGKEGWEGEEKKNHCCQSAKPSRHISSFYWARIQINILLLTMVVGLMYAVVLSSGWSHITSPEACICVCVCVCPRKH